MVMRDRPEGGADSAGRITVDRESKLSAMYSTCLFCHARLGANEAVEHFPVARRVAFDAEKGRLWALCGQCGRWNLAPLDARWEAIEECERLFAGTTLRVSTENVGLARMRDGTDLIRIGQPKRPEFAAWRYGTELIRRTRRVGGVPNLLRNSLLSAQVTVGAAITSLFPGQPLVNEVTGPNPAVLVLLGAMALTATGPALLRAHLPVARVPDGGGRRLLVMRKHLRRSRLIAAPDGFALSVPHAGGRTLLEGDAARHGAQVLLARINWAGARPALVTHAADVLEDHGDPEAALRAIARQALPPVKPLERYRAIQEEFGDRGTAERVKLREAMPNRMLPVGSLHHLLPSRLLALEMALHEESEHRALRGELASLRAAWREAEEVADVADRLLRPHFLAREIRPT
jgi:hypothetical protein